MTELDFEELDKAVSSLMQGVDTSKRNPSLDDPEERVVNLGVESHTPTDPPTPPVEFQPAPVDVNQTPVAVKRRGRFMDVVHSSSDMRPQSGLANHHATAIKPPVLVSDVIPKPPEARVPQQPDVDLLESGYVPEMEKRLPESTPDGEPLVDDDEPDIMEFPEDKSLISPFLPGAKVEKRPLGGVPQVTEEPPLPEVPDTDDDLGDDTVPPDVSQLKTQFPAELVGDVMAIESAGSVHTETESSDHLETLHDAPEEKPTYPEKLDLPGTSLSSGLIRTASEDLLSDGGVALATPTAEKEIMDGSGEPGTAGILRESSKAHNDYGAVLAAGMGSISQQYTEQPSTGDQTSGPIFDTATYHQPLEHAAKKSGVVVLMWIILLMAVGAAAGAAYFYFTTR